MKFPFLLLRIIFVLLVLGLPIHAFASLDAGKNKKIAGDVNRDGAVDRADLRIVLNNYGTESGATWADGDVTGDGKVDSADLGEVLNIIKKKDDSTDASPK